MGANALTARCHVIRGAARAGQLWQAGERIAGPSSEGLSWLKIGISIVGMVRLCLTSAWARRATNRQPLAFSFALAVPYHTARCCAALHGKLCRSSAAPCAELDTHLHPCGHAGMGQQGLSGIERPKLARNGVWKKACLLDGPYFAIGATPAAWAGDQGPGRVPRAKGIPGSTPAAHDYLYTALHPPGAFGIFRLVTHL
jgi:hypothetical protein